MKKLNPSHVLCNIFLTALVAFSGIGCLVTAFELTVEPAAIVTGVLLWSALFNLGFSRIYTMIPLVLVLAQYLWKLSAGNLTAHLESFLWNVTHVYDLAYDLGCTIWWTADNHLGADTTAFFQLLAIAATLATGAGLTRRRTLPGLLTGLVLLIPCCFVTNMTPGAEMLFLWIFAICLLLLSAFVRRTQEKTGRFFLQNFLPVLLCLTLLFAAVPQESFVPQKSWFTQWLESLEGTEPQPTEPPQTSPSATTPVESGPAGEDLPIVNLSTVGPKKFSVSRKFTLLTDYSGPVYLRGTGYTFYTGSAWYAKEGTTDTEMAPAFLREETQTTHILYERTNIRLIPYYSPDVLFTNGSVPLDSDIRELEEISYPLIRGWASAWRKQYGDVFTLSSAPDLPALSNYLALPSATKSDAEEILRQIGCEGDMDYLTAAQLIRDYVRASAEYSLQTPRMPKEATDFALWFLQSSETGYCVHFASAATVLLRAAGIPARYVEGYTVEVTAGERKSVVGGNAHAWVEFYLPGAGWMILEPTPSIPLPPETEPTEPSTAPTEPTTQPTEPTAKPTQPATKPTQPVTPPKPGFDSSALGDAAGILCILALVILQWKLRLAWLERHLRKGNENRRALTLWRHICFLAALANETPPEALLALANKAKFSQHRITEEELQEFEAYRQSCIAGMKKRNVFLQAFCRLILALY